MNFNHLRAFYRVADCKSFTVAAKKLHVSQSTLSLQVQSLEKKHGLVLINRQKRRRNSGAPCGRGMYYRLYQTGFHD